jgi:threonine synthase
VVRSLRKPHLGATKLAVPSAGNAGGAMAAYAARAGLEAHVFMPQDVPAANILDAGSEAITRRVREQINRLLA